MNAVRTFAIHLRLPFQLALAPFFLLGTWLSGMPPDLAWLAVFLLVHAGLYGGATVYNSVYDRDEGPIGMLKRPPPLGPGALWPSLALQGASVAGIAWLAPEAGLVALALALMGIAYSRPWPRLKSRLGAGLVLVALGQGAMAVLLGYFAATRQPPAPAVWLFAGVASLLVMGLYPLTQIYQIDEDGRRGDRTFAVRYGWRATMAFAAAVAGPAVAALGYLLRGAFGGFWPAVLAAALAGMGLFLWDWWRRFERLGPDGNHDRAMALSIGVAAPVAGLLLVDLLERLP